MEPYSITTSSMTGSLSIVAPIDIGHACVVCKIAFAVPDDAVSLPCNHKFHADCQWGIDHESKCPSCGHWPFDYSPPRNEKITVPLQSKPRHSSASKPVQYKACLDCRQKKKRCFHINPNPRNRNKPGNACVKCKHLKKRCHGVPCVRCRTLGEVCQPQPATASTKGAQAHFIPFCSEGSQEILDIDQSLLLQGLPPVMLTQSDSETTESQSQDEAPEASMPEFMDGSIGGHNNNSFSWHQQDDFSNMPTSLPPCHGGPQCSSCGNSDYHYSSLVRSQPLNFTNTHPVYNNHRPPTPRQQPLESVTPVGSKESTQCRMPANIKLILSLLSSDALAEYYRLLAPARNDEVFRYEGLYGAAFGPGVLGCTWLRENLEDQFAASSDLEALNIICQLGTVLFKLFGVGSEFCRASGDSKLLSMFLENIQQCFQIELCDGCSSELNSFRNDSFPIPRDVLQGYLIWRILVWYDYVCFQDKNCSGSGHSANLNDFAEKIPGVVKRLLHSCGFSDIELIFPFPA